MSYLLLFMTLGGLVCILGGLYLTRRTLKMTREDGEEDKRSAGLDIRLFEALKFDIKNYGPGVATLAFGIILMCMAPILKLRDNSERLRELETEKANLRDSLRRLKDQINVLNTRFTVHGTVQKEGEETHQDIAIGQMPPQPTHINENGQFIIKGVQRRQEDDLLIDADGYYRETINLNPNESEYPTTINGKQIKIDTTIILSRDIN